MRCEVSLAVRTSWSCFRPVVNLGSFLLSFDINIILPLHKILKLNEINFMYNKNDEWKFQKFMLMLSMFNALLNEWHGNNFLYLNHLFIFSPKFSIHSRYSRHQERTVFCPEGGDPLVSVRLWRTLEVARFLHSTLYV